MLESKKVLVAPLDWGLGHATRCIPIIKYLIESNAEVIIASNGPSLILLKKEFPTLTSLKLPPYNIKYYSRNMGINMILQFPKIVYAIISEHLILKRIIKQYNIDIIISDNRFGCFNKNIKSIFITHQLYIQMPKQLKFLGGIIRSVNHFFIRKFDECWIPDFEDKTQSLSGNLSHPPPNFLHKYVGPLSRMNFEKTTINRRILVILSGPEPERTRVEKRLIKALKSTTDSILLIQGKPDKLIKQKEIAPNFISQNFMTSDTLNQAILESEIIICRAGYTSIMDLVILGKKAILIPTPGQTEQEYLAEYFDQRGLFIKLDQKKIGWEVLLEKIEYLKKLEAPKLDTPIQKQKELIVQLLN